ncbi:MAG: hypothetical protein WDM96_15305 [Lacunisphaera sp.]
MQRNTRRGLCVGVDLIGERIVRAKKKATRAKLANCHFIRAEARELIDALPAGVTFAEVWVLFPDPLAEEASPQEPPPAAVVLRIHRQPDEGRGPALLPDRSC